MTKARQVTSIINILIRIRAIATFMYVTVIFVPTQYLVSVQNFHVNDVPLGGYAYIESTRKANITLRGHVIEEINIIRKDGVEVSYRLERETLTEKGQKTVKRKINHQHLELGDYELYLVITYKIRGIEKKLVLNDTYKVY